MQDPDELAKALENRDRETVVRIMSVLARHVADAAREKDYAQLCELFENLQEMQVRVKRWFLGPVPAQDGWLGYEALGLAIGVRMVCAECMLTIIPPETLALARTHKDILQSIQRDPGIFLNALWLCLPQEMTIHTTRAAVTKLSRHQLVDIVLTSWRSDSELSLTPFGEDVFKQIENDDAVQ